MSDEILPKTSAGRLYCLIEKGTEIGYVAQGNSSRWENAGTVWAKILGADENDPIALCNLHGKVLSLLADIEMDFHRIHGAQARRFTYFLSSIASKMQEIHSNSEWGYIQGIFDEAAMSSLALTAVTMELFHEEFIVGPDQLTHWKEEVSRLREEINASSIEVEFKRELVRLLEELEQALRDYQIVGSPGLQKEAKTIFGAIVLRKSSTTSSDEENEKLSKVLNLAASIVTVLGYSIKFYNSIAANNNWPQLPGGD